MTETKEIDNGTSGARESKAESRHDRLISYLPTLVRITIEGAAPGRGLGECEGGKTNICDEVERGREGLGGV